MKTYRLPFWRQLSQTFREALMPIAVGYREEGRSLRGRVWQDLSRGAQHDHEEKSSYVRDFLS